MEKTENRLADPNRKKDSPAPTERTQTTPEIPDDNSAVPDEQDRTESAQPSGEVRETVTNQDEQQKTTNADSGKDALDEKEKEGV
jgi:hypothetical protein